VLFGRDEELHAIVKRLDEMQAMYIRAQHQFGQLQPALDQVERSDMLAVVVHEIEGEHREFMLPIGSHSCLEAPEIGVPFAGGEDELAVDHRGLARDARQRLREARQALGPVVAAPAMELHLAAVLDDLEAVAVELRLMQPGVALRRRPWECRVG